MSTATIADASLPSHTPQTTSTDRSTVVLLKGVSKTYFKPDGSVAVRALDHVDLSIQRGEYVAIMGFSGSGKSTLMNLLGCLDRPTEGTFLLDGEDVASMSDEHLSKVRGEKIGFIFQAFNLISELTIQENAEVPMFYRGIPPADRRRKSAAALQTVGLGDRMTHRPSELSGGQQQRAAIARALVNDPAIILADEPTGNLDSTTGRAILDVLDELHRGGMTLIMVTHDDRIAERCERIVRLADGRVESDRVLRRRGRVAPAQV